MTLLCLETVPHYYSIVQQGRSATCQTPLQLGCRHATQALWSWKQVVGDGWNMKLARVLAET